MPLVLEDPTWSSIGGGRLGSEAFAQAGPDDDADGGWAAISHRVCSGTQLGDKSGQILVNSKRIFPTGSHGVFHGGYLEVPCTIVRSSSLWQ